MVGIKLNADASVSVTHARTSRLGWHSKAAHNLYRNTVAAGSVHFHATNGKRQQRADKTRPMHQRRRRQCILHVANIFGAFHFTISAKLFDPIRNNTLGNVLNVSAVGSGFTQTVCVLFMPPVNLLTSNHSLFQPPRTLSISRWLFSIARMRWSTGSQHSSIYYLVIVSCFPGKRIFALFAQMDGTTLLRIYTLYRRAVDTWKWILAQCTRI